MSQTLNKIIRAYPDEKFVMVKGFGDAVIGLDLDSGRLIYSVGKCIDVLMYDDEMPFEDAVLYFEKNVRDQYEDVENGPIWANTEF